MSATVAHRSRPLAPAYRKHAGHAGHFLERLERIDGRQLELALTLYKDPALVRATLARACLPEQAERVAISLEHPTEGPFVIVTREGRFVTCLAAGMRPRHIVLTRAELDAAARDVERMREKLARIDEACRHRGRTLAIVRNVIDGGEHVSREQIEALLRWEPLFGDLFLIGVGTYGAELLQWAPRVRTIQKPKPRHEALLFAYHRALYGLAHFFVLAGASEISGPWIERVTETCPVPMTFSSFGSAFDVGYLTYRAMWASARWPAALPLYQQMLRSADEAMELSDAYLGIAAIGLANRSVRAECQRTIARERPVEESLAKRALRHRQTLEVAFTNTDEVSALALERARSALTERVPGLRADEVSDRDARAQLASAPGHAVRTKEDIGAAGIALPAIVSADPLDLYLPQRLVDEVRTPWSMEKTIALLASHREAYGVRRPVRVDRRAGRNDPCPCGSGVKRKRCAHARERCHA